MAELLAEESPYYEEEEKRQRLRRRIWIGIGLFLVLAVVGWRLWIFYQERREVQLVEQFLLLIEQGNWQQAYRLWGCTEEKPCRDYPFEKFLQDWSENGFYRRGGAPHIASSEYCDEGTIVTVMSGEEKAFLWVDREQKIIGFAPWPVCNPVVRVPVVPQ